MKTKTSCNWIGTISGILSTSYNLALSGVSAPNDNEHQETESKIGIELQAIHVPVEVECENPVVARLANLEIP